MTRILMLVAAGIMAMVLGACGEGSKKPEEMKSDAAVEQTQDNSQQDQAAQTGDQQPAQDNQAGDPQDSQQAPESDAPAAPAEQ